MLKLITFALCLLLALPAHAQRAAGIIGAGTVTCGMYVDDRTNAVPAQSFHYFNWMQGYLSAYNQFSVHPQIAVIPNPDTLALYLDKYCRDHPLDTLLMGAFALLSDLGGWSSPAIKKLK